jgi:hypothetical protein
VRRVFGHKEWKIFVEWKHFSTEELQNLLFFMLDGGDKIKGDEMDEKICVREGMKNMKLSFTI